MYFVDEERGIRKMLVNQEGNIQNFPGIIRENFWVEEVTERSMEPKVRFRTYFEFQGNGWTMYWQVQPDGRYWGDDGGFGIENDEEVILQASVDMDGCFTGPFRIYSMGSEKY